MDGQESQEKTRRVQLGEVRSIWTVGGARRCLSHPASMDTGSQSPRTKSCLVSFASYEPSVAFRKRPAAAWHACAGVESLVIIGSDKADREPKT